MPNKIKYDREKCIGAGSCVQIAPETWKLDDKDGKAIQLKKQCSNDELEKNVEAAKSCPTHAIEVYDETGKQLV